MNLAQERIACLAERLGLSDISSIAPGLAEEAAAKELSYTEFLERVLKAQVEAADIRAAETLTRLAGFPFIKTIDEFDFSYQPSISKKQIKELSSCAFVERKENVIFLGPPGVGKTHLAVALGMAAARKRFRIKFTTAAKMISSLIEARRNSTFTRRLSVYTKPSLLIIDEIGFLPLSPDEASILFEVISRRYERGSIILTSNKSYGEWGEVFSGDTVIASAILDRLLHHSETIAIKGKSYRLKEKRKAGVVRD